MLWNNGGAKPGRVDLLPIAHGVSDFRIDPRRSAFRRHEIVFEFRDPVTHDLERIAAGFGLRSSQAARKNASG
jgi:hypothetical protein